MMDKDTFDSLPGNELTDEERAVLAAFDSADLGALSATPAQASSLAPIVDEDMQVIFVEEVAIDCITLEQVLEWRPASERSSEDAAQAQTIQRIAHKLKGTCGAMHCDMLAALALHTETLTKLIVQNAVAAPVGWQGLEYASHALQETLEDFAASGQEDPAFLTAFEDKCRALGLELQSSLPGHDEAADAIYRPPTGQLFVPMPFVRANAQRVDKLLGHTERLAALGTLIAQAQADVDSAFQELHAAEDRLHRLETRLTGHLTLRGQQQDGRGPLDHAFEDDEEHSTSSLVERILDEASRRTGRFVPRRALFPAREISAVNLASVEWDELEMDRFKEEGMLALSLSEAVADVSIAASQLRIAFAQLTRLLREQATQATQVRDDALLLSLTPLDMLLKRIEQEVERENRNQPSPIRCEVTGETTEIDQEIVEQLAPLLLQLIHASLATYTLSSTAEPSSARMWLHVRAVGSVVLIEIGFSMDVAGGAFEEVAAGIAALGGEIEPRRNIQGGVSYHLRLPRSHGTVHAVILRERGHRFAVPLSQIARVALTSTQDATTAPSLTLSQLLVLPEGADSSSGGGSLSGHPVRGTGKEVIISRSSSSRPSSDVPWKASASSRPAVYLTLALNHEERGTSPGAEIGAMRIQVDEVVGDAVLIIKPLPAHLQRPGIAGAAIDGANTVLLLLDLAELLRQHNHRTQSETGAPFTGADYLSPREIIISHPPRPRTTVVADDSVSMRQFLHQILTHANYQVHDARDGIEALELLQRYLPDALILDVEMPNLNGYDVLSRMRAYPELANVKIVMLTSRFTEKHQTRAKALGAHAYLTKPCDPDTLLETLERLLTARSI